MQICHLDGFYQHSHILTMLIEYKAFIFMKKKKADQTAQCNMEQGSTISLSLVEC